MKNEKFKILQFIREFILMEDKEMDNFAKKDIELKNRIKMNTYDILELAYEANVTVQIETKKQLLYKVLAKIKVVDFLLNISYDKQIITSKKYMKLANKLDDIVKYITGWVNALNKINITN